MTTTRDTPTRPETARAYTERMIEKTVLLADIQPHPDNPRRHPESQILQLKASHEQLGQFEPVILWQRPKGYIQVKGHGYDEGVKRTQDEAVKAWILPEDTPPAFVTQIMLASNLHAQNSYDDTGLLSKLLQEQQELGIDLAALGTSEENLQALLDELESEHEDAYIEGAGGDEFDTTLQEDGPTRTHVGELWQLGKHRLYVGDSSDKACMQLLLGDEMIDAIITDPPYAFGLASMSNMNTKSGGWHDMMNNASWFTDRYHQWRRLVRNGPLWVFCNWRTLPILMRASFDSGVGLNNVMVWYKDWIGPGGIKGLRPTYELIGLSILGNYTISDRGIEDFIKVGWSSHKPSGHQAEKPVDLITHLLDVSQCSTVYDPFGGSGTLVIAAQRTNCQARVCEIDPKWADVILRRYEAETGDTARLLERSEEAAHAL